MSVYQQIAACQSQQWYSNRMYPVLVNLGVTQISSFGFFLALAFLMGALTIWRIARSYEMEEESLIDLVLLTFFGGFIGARLTFILSHLGLFDSWTKAFLLNRYPGLSLWGGIIFGLVTLWIFSYRAKVSFWKLADFAAVAVVLGMSFGDVGCFLSGCMYGISSNLPIATPVVGILDKRLPIALFEAVAFLVVFWHLWKHVIRFHYNGKIVAEFLVSLGIIRLISEFFRGDSQILYKWISLGQILAVVSIVGGIVVIYTQSRRSVRSDIQAFGRLFTSSKQRQIALHVFRKTWYNQSISWRIRMGKITRRFHSQPKRLMKKLNVKSTPEHLK